jgi:zinc protease
MQPIRRVLPSGLEVLVAPRHDADVVSVQIYVWIGSLHEKSNERGAAHFIEHMLFKGTAKRKVGEIGAMIEGAGGDINAYTTFDRTVYYATVPAAQLDLAMDVLSDAVLESVFDSAELEREREVVIEEIRRSNDDPGSLVGKKIFELMYRGSEAGRPIIGSEMSVAGMSRDDLIGFYERHYNLANMSVVVVGNVDAQEVIELTKKYFETDTDVAELPRGRVSASMHLQRPGGVATILGDYAQTRVEIAFPGPSASDLDGVYVDLGAYVFGGSELSRLQKRLRDRDGIVSAIGCSAYSPSFRGVIEISAAVEPENILKVIHDVAYELNNFLSLEPAEDVDLTRAAAAFKINRIHRDETVDGVARALGQSLGTPLKEKFEDTYEAFVGTASPQDVVEGLKRWIDPDQVAIVVLGANSIELTKDELIQAFAAGWKKVDFDSRKPLATKLKGIEEPKVHRLNLKNGVPIVYRQLPDAKMFCLIATTDGGLRFEDSNSAGMFHAAAGMLGLATDKQSYDEFTSQLEDLGSVVSGFSGKDSCGWEVHSILDNVPVTLQMWSEAFLASKIPEEQWVSQKRETLHTFKMQMDSGAYRCMRLLSEKVYGDHPYGAPVLGWPETVEQWNASDLETFYAKWRDSGRWLIAAAGSMDPVKLQDLLNQGFGNWKPQNLERRSSVSVRAPRGVPSTISAEMDKEQAHVAIAWRGIHWADPNRATLDVLMGILGGHGGRLFTKLRDQQSLAYTVSPLAHQGVEAGLVGAYIACKPDKQEQALFGLKQEFILVIDQLVSDEELTRAKNHLVGSHKIGLQRTSSQAMTMALMELYGQGWDDFLKYPLQVQKVSKEGIQKLAQSLFASEPHQVLVGLGIK